MKRYLLTFLILCSFPSWIFGANPLSQEFIDQANSKDIFTDFVFIEQTLEQMFPRQERGPVWNTYGNESKGMNPRWRGRFESKPIVLDSNMVLFMTGYPKFSCFFHMREIDSGAQLTLHFRNNPPMRQWEKFVWEIPSDWVGREVVLVLEDISDSPFYGWFGFAWAASPDRCFEGLKLNLHHLASLLSLLVQGLLFLFPGWVLRNILIDKFELHQNLELPLVLVGSSLVGYLGFYVFFLSPDAGKVYSLILFIGCVWFVFLTKPCLRLSGPAIEPLVLVMIVAVFQWSAALLILSNDSIYELTKARFFGSIAPDSRIPHLFASKLYFGEPMRPFLLDWLSSDRPPLQTGSYLIQMPFLTHSFPQYFVLGTILQSTVFAGAHYALMRIFRNRRLMGVCLSLMLFSGITMQNVFYAWPKLYSTSFVFLLAGLVFERRSLCYSKFNRLLKWMLVSICAALALLAHGAGLFAFLPLFLVFALRGCYPSWKHVVLTVGLFSVMYGPWVAYQKLADPPGDRLLKWHFAGKPERTKEGAIETIRQAYRSTSWRQWWEMRWQNVKILLQDSDRFADFLSLEHYQSGFENYKKRAYWSFVLVQGPISWLCIGLPLLIWKGKITRNRMFFTTLVLLTGLLFWILLMFAGGSTTPHHGSYFFNYLFLVIAGYVVYRLDRNLAFPILALNGLFICIVWIYPPFNFGVADTVFSQSTISAVMAFFNLLSFTGLMVWTCKQTSPAGSLSALVLWTPFGSARRRSQLSCHHN